MNRRSGFTLLELLVVIVILSILAMMTVQGVDSARRKAREQTCRNNLKQLCAAVMHYAEDHSGMLPLAQSHETYDPLSKIYSLSTGWVSWIKKSAPADPLAVEEQGWPNKTSFSAQYADDTGCWIHDGKGKPSQNPVLNAIETGSLSDYVPDSAIYVCPVIAREAEARYKAAKGKKTLVVSRTYAMNYVFGSAASRTTSGVRSSYIGVTHKIAGHVAEPAKLLLFSESFPDYKNEKGYIARGGYGDTARKEENTHDATISPAKFDGTGKTDDLLCKDRHKSNSYGVHTTGDAGVLGSLVIFYDGHIETVYGRVPIRDESTGDITKWGANTAWFLCHAYAPANEKPAGVK